jgi:hypothetical protein
MQFKDIVYYGIVIALLIACIYMIHLMKTETAECIRNPFIYGAKTMGNVSCSCNQWINKECITGFSFNDIAMETPETQCNGILK